jgi:hypothetical protein
VANSWCLLEVPVTANLQLPESPLNLHAPHNAQVPFCQVQTLGTYTEIACAVLCCAVLCCAVLCCAVSRFPRMGPQVFLRMPVLKKDKAVRVEFMAFGGGWVDQTLKKAMEATPHTGVSVWFCVVVFVVMVVSHALLVLGSWLVAFRALGCLRVFGTAAACNLCQLTAPFDTTPHCPTHAPPFTSPPNDTRPQPQRE